MNITICKLTPELAEDYVRFFDTTPHWYDSDKNKCYCVPYCNDDYEVIKSLVTSEEGKRNYAIQCVKGGNLQGYLAYCDNKIAGWCNANTKSDCLKCYGWTRCLGSIPTEESTIGIKVKSVFCFVIAPEMRRKGIATLLLEHVCQDAVQDGFDFVEAYPEKIFINECEDYMGPVELYRKSGFSVYYETEQKFVMRKPVKII
ncbi:MAG: GNAT family N-acetyltransferase [Oscillospiraceae bacterium]|nr:GNAT family N-acetyltransferase [Oscillospiraceae bacterium]